MCLDFIVHCGREQASFVTLNLAVIQSLNKTHPYRLPEGRLGKGRRGRPQSHAIWHPVASYDKPDA